MAEVHIDTPLGIAKVIGDAFGISSIEVTDAVSFEKKDIPTVLAEAVVQLQEYFSGTRTQFDMLLNPKGTLFQKKVWKALQDIPYGKTQSYLQLSKTLGDAKAVRAVAAANGKNPLWIVVPCHRVIGSDGSLTGYAGGLGRKRWLLAHESPAKQQTLF